MGDHPMKDCLTNATPSVEYLVSGWEGSVGRLSGAFVDPNVAVAKGQLQKVVKVFPSLSGFDKVCFG